MAKRTIWIAGKKLFEVSIPDIVAFASRTGHDRFDLGPSGQHFMNKELLTAFKGKTERTTSELVSGFCDLHRDWSEQFNALRAGECLGWSVEQSIVQRVVDEHGRTLPHSWRLLQAELQFELVGTGPRQRAIRIYNAGADQAENWRLWVRESKRRERARVKKLEKLRPGIEKNLSLICRLDPTTEVTSIAMLAPFAVGDIRSLSACRQLVLDELDGMSEPDIVNLHYSLDLALMRLDWHETRKPSSPQAAPAEALAELDDFSL